jgi:uncharacterized protein YjbJ (UPF0337 family)
MSTEEKGKATGENIVGKAKEALGNLTGDPETKTEGQADQAKGQARHTKENVKDDVKDILK